MPAVRTLEAALDEILDAAVRRVKTVSDFRTVVRGDRSRPSPETPCCWVFAEPAEAEHPPFALAERWRIPLVLVSVVSDDEPEAGYAEATRLAARARKAAVAGRTLDGAASDVVSIRFEPSAPFHSEGSLYASVAVVQATFVTYEP